MTTRGSRVIDRGFRGRVRRLHPLPGGVARILVALPLLAGCGKDKPPGPDTTPPSAVTDLALVSTTETSLTVTWTAPGDDGDKGRAASYDLRYSLAALPAAWDTAAVVAGLAAPAHPGEQETVTVTGLARNGIYFVALRTLDDAGNASDLSNILQAQAGDMVPPGQVTDLAAGTLEPRAVTLEFSAPGDDGYIGTAAAYEVRRSATPLTEADWADGTPLEVAQSPQPSGWSEAVRVRGFTPLETVHVALRARDDGGNLGPVSNDVEVTLPADTVAPAAIKDLAVGGIELFTQTLSWTAPGNDGSEGRAAAYAIRYAEAAITADTWDGATPVSVSLTPKEAGEWEEVTLTGLPGGKWLWFCVRAVDDMGNWSGVSNATKSYVRREPRVWAIRVDGSGDAPGVQAGIDSAGAGDTVLVYPGWYYENIDYLGKDLVVRSAEGPEGTILDGSTRDSSVVVIRRGETRAAVLEGFTITGGIGTWNGDDNDGAGVYCVNSSPVIKGNRIIGNHCTLGGLGGGICAGARRQDGDPLAARIEGNLIEGNSAGRNGGGIACFNGEHEIVGNTFRGNTCAADGGGIWVWMTSGRVLIRGNEFWGNMAGDHGGGVYAYGAPAARPYMIERNLYVNNQTTGVGHIGDTGSGGGIAALSIGGVIRHNTLVDNDGQHLTHDGGGGLLLYLTGPDLSVFGNIIAFNRESGISCWWEGTTAAVGPNLLWENSPGDLGSGLGACPSAWADVLLFADPLFCDPANDDYRVASNSPALTGEEVMGAYAEPGCGPLDATPAGTWNRLRTMYRD